MGPTKMMIKDNTLYDAITGKKVHERFATRREMDEYAAHHYLVLPVVDQTGRSWEVDGRPVYCLHGASYETIDGSVIHAARCPDCGGMAIRMDEPAVQSECVHCTQCGHEFDARLEMMES
ncbi:MAG TPA: hypothetical protein VLY45_06115 [Nitrospiria bacterium]|nr:hypothetical protein [Nitrospiria bacterium]